MIQNLFHPKFQNPLTVIPSSYGILSFIRSQEIRTTDLYYMSLSLPKVEEIEPKAVFCGERGTTCVVST